MVETLADYVGKDKQRLDKTEEQLGTTDVNNYFEIPFDVVYANMANIKVNQQQITGSDFIWGHPVHGIWGSFLWSGSFTGSLVRTTESACYIDFTESFTTTTYRNAGSTTASGWGTGSLVFSLSGSVMQTINIGSDIGVSTTKFNRAQFTPYGSYVHLLVGSFSTNNGSTWFSANPYEEIYMSPSGSLGSEILFRGIDTTGSVVLESIEFIIKQDDF